VAESRSTPAPAGSPALFADRYELHELLGRGGMAAVYRAVDRSTGRTLALKQLTPPRRREKRASHQALFEREFHTLAQLSHPRVIAVYDYGVTGDGLPYYTMELLDGGDLRERAPLPWREACALLFDVCSSLALLHSRRLLHRDISPRNIRCTRDGTAKLIDFGAMAPMTGGGAAIVGTPAFTAPETVQRSALDARTDLYALGGSLYFALTGQIPYAARSFAELFTAWNRKALPPSAHVADIPRALDDLVLSLLSIEPALRPHSAFEVMQRLATIAGLEQRESIGVSRAYLATPLLVGRDDLLDTFRRKLLRVQDGRGSGLLLTAAPGLGRSRLLDACALEAKTLGARVLRAATSGKLHDFEVAWALADHLLEALPSQALAEQFPLLFERAANDGTGSEPAQAASRLRDASARSTDPEQLQRSLVRLMRAASRSQTLVLAVDDVHRIDQPSAAVLAALLDASAHERVLVALTSDAQAEASPALDVLARRCERHSLPPLSEAQTEGLFDSVFGSVPNLERLTREIFKLAHGNPRQSMDLAQHLLDRGKVAYAAGTWTLPASLSPADLPQSAEDAIVQRCASLGPLARFLAEAQALAFDEVFAHVDYRALAAHADSAAVDAAIAELVSQQALIPDGDGYTIANRVWLAALSDGLAPAERERRHAALADFYRARSSVALIHHLFLAGRDEEGLDALLTRHREYASHVEPQAALEQNIGKLCESYPRAIESALRLGRSPREVNDLRRWCVSSSVASDVRYYWVAAPIWIEQLKQDSGLSAYQQDAQNRDPGPRLSAALTRAVERFQATPEAERVYPVDQAIRMLGEYVACSIAIGVRCLDSALLNGLPALLEPFVPLSPVLHALWQNALGCVEANLRCEYERARERWLEVHRQLHEVTGADVQHVEAIRNAVAFAIGMVEGVFGIASAAKWADELDHDPYQKLSALYLRKVVRLEQGDRSGADRLQRRADLLALRSRVPQMFSSTLTIEVSTHARACDLSGIKYVIERERVLAARYPGWQPFLRYAEAWFDFVRGDFARAQTGFEECIERSALNAQLRSNCMPIWVASQGGRCDCLFAQGRPADARDAARAALAVCEALGIMGFAFDLRRSLALSEAKLGALSSAVARLEDLIARQLALGVSGLRLGLNYEARAQIAIWGDDAVGFDEYARLTAREYRYGANSPLGARYERLTQEAHRHGFRASAALSDFAPITITDSAATALSALGTSRAPDLDGWKGALRAVCEASAAVGGHLYAVAHEGPRLLASHGLAPPGGALDDAVLAFLSEHARSFETRTVAADEAAPLAANGGAAPVSVEGVDYELWPLMCYVDDELETAGVIAISKTQRNAPPRGLLEQLAARLLQSARSDRER
jgi:hypothetical protein